MAADLSKLDLAFVLDCTGSMGSYIQNAKDVIFKLILIPFALFLFGNFNFKNMKKISEEIQRSEKCKVNIGLIEYRDHCDTSVTTVHKLTDNMEEMKTFVESCRASGGGGII
jgi:hypothetical protein